MVKKLLAILAVSLGLLLAGPGEALGGAEKNCSELGNLEGECSTRDDCGGATCECRGAVAEVCYTGEDYINIKPCCVIR
jgi:hypothetical protein